MMTSALAIKITDAILKLKLTEPKVILSASQPLNSKQVFLNEDKIEENEIAFKVFVARDFRWSTNSNSAGREPLKGKFSSFGWKMHFGAKSHLAN